MPRILAAKRKIALTISAGLAGTRPSDRPGAPPGNHGRAKALSLPPYSSPSPEAAYLRLALVVRAWRDSDIQEASRVIFGCYQRLLSYPRFPETSAPNGCCPECARCASRASQLLRLSRTTFLRNRMALKSSSTHAPIRLLLRSTAASTCRIFGNSLLCSNMRKLCSGELHRMQELRNTGSDV